MITWAISTTIQLIIIIGLMVYGWGLQPRSWVIVIGGYVAANVMHMVVWRINTRIIERWREAKNG
jgi:hypothetical protein